MLPQFVQRYIVKQDIPVISISSSEKALIKGKLKKGEKIRGVLKDVTVMKNGKRTELSLLQFGENKYVVPKYVLLEPLSNADASSTAPIKVEENKKAPFLMKAGLPLLGLGLGLGFAHKNRSYGLTRNTTAAYLGYGLLGLFLGVLPVLIYSYNLSQKNFDKTTTDISKEQKNKDLSEKAYKILTDLAKKAGKKSKLDKDAFTMEFNSIDQKEKEAFVYIGQETLNLPLDDQSKYIAGIAEISQKATQQFGADTIKSLSEKTTIPA